MAVAMMGLAMFMLGVVGRLRGDRELVNFLHALDGAGGVIEGALHDLGRGRGFAGDAVHVHRHAALVEIGDDADRPALAVRFGSGHRLGKVGLALIELRGDLPAVSSARAAMCVHRVGQQRCRRKRQQRTRNHFHPGHADFLSGETD